MVNSSAGCSGTPQGGEARALAFATSASDVRRTIEQQERRIFPAGALWIAWPRKAAGHVSDVDENLVRDTALLRGLVDVKVAALDTDWSALKIVWRKENRPVGHTFGNTSRTEGDAEIEKTFTHHAGG